jgi:hypothetical protein
MASVAEEQNTEQIYISVLVASVLVALVLRLIFPTLSLLFAVAVVAFGFWLAWVILARVSPEFARRLTIAQYIVEDETGNWKGALLDLVFFASFFV